ncbi:MAG: hypothetical protein AB2L12_07680 [Smithellaceae bacterium]
MKRLIVVIITFLFLLVGTPLFAQSAKDSVKALKKLETLASTNIFGRDYLNAYAAAQAEVDMYLGNPESKKKLKLRNAIERTALAYKWAGKVWNLKMSKESYILESYPIYQSMCADFPDAKQSLRGTIQMDVAISWFYSQASKELSNAMELLYK